MAFYKKSQRKPQIVLVSLIDILTILLIFFVVTTTFKSPESQLPISLPTSKQSKKVTQQQERIIMAVTGDQKIFLAGEEVPLDKLADAVKAAREKSPGKSVTMKADENVPFGFVLKIYDAMKAAGLQNLPTLTDPKKSS